MKRESGCGEEENGGVGGEVGVGEENGRCVERNWVWWGCEWEVWRGKVGVMKKMGGVWRGIGCGGDASGRCGEGKWVW